MIGGLHHVELQALDLERAMLEWGWLLPRPAGEAESAFLESSERVKVELCVSDAVQV